MCSFKLFSKEYSSYLKAGYEAIELSRYHTQYGQMIIGGCRVFLIHIAAPVHCMSAVMESRCTTAAQQSVAIAIKYSIMSVCRCGIPRIQI